MKRITTIFVAAIAALVLAACTVTQEPAGPPADAFPVTANNDPSQPVDTLTFGPGDEEVYRVTVPSSVASADLLYVELDRNLRLEVRPDGTGYPSVSFSATSANFFGTGLTGVASTGAAAVEGQAVSTPVTCDGSCVILDSVPSVFYVRVVNTGSSTLNGVNLYIYGDQYSDETEDNNDDPATAPNLVAFDGGAIETVGDIDYFYMVNDGTVAFDDNEGGIALEAFIVDASGAPVANLPGPYYPGDSIQVFTGEFLRVWAADANIAASSSKSGYYLDYLEAPLSQGTRSR